MIIKHEKVPYAVLIGELEGVNLRTDFIIPCASKDDAYGLAEKYRQSNLFESSVSIFVAKRY